MIDLLKNRIWGPLQETWKRFVDDDGTLMAAAVAYYASLSLFPLLLVLVSGLGFFLDYTTVGESAREQILNAVEQQSNVQLREALENVFAQVREGQAVGGRLGLLGMLFAAVAIFAQFDRAFEVIWNAEKSPPKGLLHAVRRVFFERLRAFLLVLSLGAIVIVVFLAGVAIAAVRNVVTEWLSLPSGMWSLVAIGSTVVLNTLVFTLLYRLLPAPRIEWNEALRGAVFAAVGWEIGRQLLNLWLTRTDYASAYGVIGSFLGVMLWIYFATTVVFLGAEFIQTICRRGKVASNRS